MIAHARVESIDKCEACGRFRELLAREMYREEREALEFGLIDLGESGA